MKSELKKRQSNLFLGLSNLFFFRKAPQEKMRRDAGAVLPSLGMRKNGTMAGKEAEGCWEEMRMEIKTW